MLKKIFGVSQKKRTSPTADSTADASGIFPGSGSGSGAVSGAMSGPDATASLESSTPHSLSLSTGLSAGLSSDTSVAAPLVAVLGARGGVGTSTIALNLAGALALSDIETTIVDANFQLPDIANLIGQEAEHSILELLGRGVKTDRMLFRACRLEIASEGGNLGALLPPADGEAAIKSNLSELSECLEHIASFSSLFLVDLPNHLDKHLVTMLDRCAKIILVFEATISGVAACQRWLSIFAELGYEEDRVMLVCNRSGSKHKLVEDQLPACFVGRNSWKVANASNLLGSPSQHGLPVTMSNPTSAYARSVEKLARNLKTALFAENGSPSNSAPASKAQTVSGFSSVALSR
jgi:pilus assembly protein CpaE